MLSQLIVGVRIWNKPPPQGPPLRNIHVIMSSKPANESTEIPVAEGVQKTDPKYLDDEVVETLVPEDSEAALLQLGGDFGHSE